MTLPKKSIAQHLLAVWFIVALTILTLCLPCLAQAEDDYRKTGIIITGSKTWKPYSFLNENGQPAGFYIDFWNKWSEKTGVPVTFRLVTWAQSIELVATGECSMQSGLFQNEERAKTFAFSKPVFHTEAVKVVGAHIDCDENPSKLKWGGVEGTGEKTFADNFSLQGAEGFVSSIELFKALAEKRIQALVDDWSTVSLLGAELGMKDELKVCETVYRKDLYAIVLKDRTELIKLVDEGISHISEAEHRMIVHRWFVNSEEDGQSAAVSFPLLVSFLFVVFGVISLFWWRAKHSRGRL